MNNYANAGHAISVLSNVLTSTNNERERMSAILDRYHSEFSTERRLRLEVEAENAKLLALLDTKNAEVSALSDKNVSLENEVKMMVSAIELASQKMRDNERIITESVARISNDFPKEFSLDSALPLVNGDEVNMTPLPDPVGEQLKEKFDAIESELTAAINSRVLEVCNTNVGAD